MQLFFRDFWVFEVQQVIGLIAEQFSDRCHRQFSFNVQFQFGSMQQAARTVSARDEWALHPFERRGNNSKEELSALLPNQGGKKAYASSFYTKLISPNGERGPQSCKESWAGFKKGNQ